MPADRPFDPWAFLRHALQLGEAIARDFADRPYEQYSARLDAVARELAAELKPHLARQADDDEPVTEDWLRGIGFAPDGNPDLPDPPLAISLFYGRTDEEIESATDTSRHLLIDKQGEAIIEEYIPGGSVLGFVDMPRLTTRGHVRRLLAALGR